jgi:hypothetical protein
MEIASDGSLGSHTIEDLIRPQVFGILFIVCWWIATLWAGNGSCLCEGRSPRENTRSL